MRRLADGIEQRARGMVLGVANDRDAYAETIGHGALRNAFRGVIRALRMNVGAQLFQQLLDVQLLKENDEIHIA